MVTKFQDTNRHTQGLLFKIFPIKKKERKNVLLLCVLKALLSFTFTILKIQKNTNLCTLVSAESVAAAKTITFPIMVLVTVAHTALANRFSLTKLMYTILFFFLGSFVVYTFLLIPYRESLKPNAVHFTDLVNYGPLYENWIYVVFFFLAELFGQFGIVILFWGIANELFTRKQAKRIYHLFIVAGCLGSTLGVFFLGKLCFWVEGGRDRALIEANKLEVLDEVSYFVGGMVLETLLITAGFCFWILNKPSFVSRSHEQVAKGPRMSFLKSLEYIASNKYLVATTCLVIGCAVTTTLTDITYLSYIKSSGKKSYRTPAEFANWKCTDMLIVNAICIVAGLFLTHWIARKFSFKVNAYITPIVTIVLGSLFFMLSFLHNRYDLTNFIQNCFGTTPKLFIAFLGRFQSIAGLAFKYIFFDATKEMVFITMGPQARKKGKSAVDAVGSRFGKALSSFIHMTVLSIFAIREVYKVSHILLVIFMFFGVGWFLSVNFLSKELAKKEKAKARMAQ